MLLISSILFDEFGGIILINVFELFTTKCIWTPEGVKCQSHEEAQLVNKFMRQCIYDSKLYVTKAIGYRVIGDINKSTISVNISRSKRLGDSYVEMSTLLEDKIFTDVKAVDRESVILPLHLGLNTLDTDCQFVVNREPIEVLWTKPLVGRALQGPVKIDVLITTAQGHRDMRRNSKTMSDNYFPMNSYHTVIDYVRVEPTPAGNLVKLHYDFGMTPEVLQRMFVFYVSKHRIWDENFIPEPLRDLYNTQCK